MKVFLAGLCLTAATPAPAQVDDYRFDAGRVPVGQVSHYLKSQRDGTHPARVSVYVAAVDRVEAVKWERNGAEATLVTAQMDWTKFSVRAFEAWHLARGAQPERRATLSVEGNQLRTSFTPQPLRISHWPWHSYDFDFTSFTLTLPHRADPRRALTFWRTDYVHGDAPAMAELGEVTLRYVGREARGGVPVWRYTLGGPGLEGKTGDWWVDRRSGLTVEYALPVGDEPGYADVRFKLDSRSALSAEEWQAFKRAAVAGS